MIRATWKSLLARKVRLLMSTFAISLGVAFVVGSLVFSAALSNGFNRLFGSSVGDVVVRPEGSATLNGDPSTRTVPGSLVQKLAQVPGAARADGNVQALGVFVVGKDRKVVGGLGAPTYGISYSDAPAGHGIPGLTLLHGHPPHGPHQVVLDEKTAEKGGYVIGEQVPIVTATRRAVLTERLVGLAGYADNTSLAGATLTIFDVPTAQKLFLHGQDAFTNVWVTAQPGVSQSELRDHVAQVLPPNVRAVTGDDAADESASPVLKGISFLRTFLLIFAAVALVVGAYLIVNTFSILVAQRSRELALLRAIGASRRQVSRSVLLEALVLGVIGATVGLALGMGLAFAIRWLIGLVGLDLGNEPLVLDTQAVVAGYATGVTVTMVAAWLPARRTGRIMPVQALGDVVALPESSIRWRFVLGLALTDRGRGRHLRRTLRVISPLGVLGRRRHPRRPAGRHRRGTHRLPAPPDARPLAVRRGVPRRGQPRRPERAAQSAAYDGDGVGSDDRPGPGLHDVDHRRVGEGQRGRDDRQELHRQLRRR